MTREEAIKLLKEYATRVKPFNEPQRTEYKQAVDMAIEALSAEAVQGWIPCSEKLPREYAQYLVCFESGECYVYWLEDSDWARGIAEKEGIIAWMPLPKPYKGGERSE